jgi:hypothetical protein
MRCLTQQFHRAAGNCVYFSKLESESARAVADAREHIGLGGHACPGVCITHIWEVVARNSFAFSRHHGGLRSLCTSRDFRPGCMFPTPVHAGQAIPCHGQYNSHKPEAYTRCLSHPLDAINILAMT